MSTLERLRESGIPTDWHTVYLGWHGMGSRGRWIGSGEVRDWAFERLTSGQPPAENENALIDLAFVDPSDHWTVQRCLEQLAAASPQDPERSRSVWRWFFLDEVVAGLENQLAVRPSDDSLEYPYWQWHEDFFTALNCSLENFWDEFPFPAGEFSVAADDFVELWEKVKGESGEQYLAEYRRWLARERDVLIAGSNPDEQKAFRSLL